MSVLAIFDCIGNLVDDSLHVDYTSTVFVYNSTVAEAVSRQRSEHQRRTMKRRMVTEEPIQTAIDSTTPLTSPINVVSTQVLATDT